MSDASRAYQAGVVQVSLNHAAAALTDALVAATGTVPFESHLVQAILAAQNDVNAAQRCEIDWNA